MDLSEILSIAGKPGLFKLVAKSKNNVIVESMNDKKRFPVFATDRMSSLEEISVFTEGENIPLKDILRKMKDKHNGGTSIDSNSDGNVLREYFEEIVPDYDRERVYNSDIKKIISWYNLLVTEDLLDFKEEEITENESGQTETEEKQENQE